MKVETGATPIDTSKNVQTVAANPGNPTTSTAGGKILFVGGFTGWQNVSAHFSNTGHASELTSFAEFSELATPLEFDVIVTMISEAADIQVISAMSPNECHTPFIAVISDDAPQGTSLEALKAGADSYLNEPLVLPELIIYVERALEKRNLLLSTADVLRNTRAAAAAVSTPAQPSASSYHGNLFQMVSTLINILEAKDPHMEYHSERVTKFCQMVGQKLGLPDLQMRQLQLGALLHDIGNLGVRDHVLQKNGRLSEEEYEHMMSHTEIGESLLRDLFDDLGIIQAVKYHHEFFNGRGRYGLKRENIPLVARIVAVADSYDAMTSVRPFRPAKTHDDAILELRRASGSQFDPDVVKAFLGVLSAD